MIYSMNYKLIVAMDNLKGIGLNNKLPWSMIKEDMQMFRKLTIGDGKNAVIMGRNTYLGLPNILKERDNLVLSKKLNNPGINNLFIFSDIASLLEFCKNKYREVWIIGGAEIYKQFLDLNIINKIYLTTIDNDYNCDCFFPETKLSEFSLLSSRESKTNDNIKINFTIYEKI